jgi:hypothetical protein
LSPREPTLGEVADDLRELREWMATEGKETRAALDRLTNQVASTYVRQDVYLAEQTAIKGRVAAVEERNQWLARTALTALALPIIVGVVVAVLLMGVTA